MKLAKISNSIGNYVFFCPGCKMHHRFQDQTGDQPGAKWDFNGNHENVTIHPSYLTWWDQWSGDPEKPITHRCHSWIKDGKIQFLDDSTHWLKGQTVDLPDVEI